MKTYVYESKFTDGRENFSDLVNAETITEAKTVAADILRGIDETGYGCDEWVEATVICELAAFYPDD